MAAAKTVKAPPVIRKEDPKKKSEAPPKVVVKDAPVKEVKPKAEEPPVVEIIEEEPVEEVSPKDDKVKRQFVTKHERGWQVKLEGSSKATKVFKTKLEAEAYAKELAKKQDTTVVRKKKDGKFQKMKY